MHNEKNMIVESQAVLVLEKNKGRYVVLKGCQDTDIVGPHRSRFKLHQSYRPLPPLYSGV